MSAERQALPGPAALAPAMSDTATAFAPAGSAPTGPGAGPEGWAADLRRPIPLIEAMEIARRAVEQLTGLRIDAVAQTERGSDGGWTVTIDMVEAKARMGSNDLLCAYEITLGPDGELTAFGRRHRYHRESGSPA